MPVALRIAADPGDIDRVRKLFRESRQTVGGDVCFHDFGRELATLPGDYVVPRGLLYVASADGAAAGCVGLRPLSGPDRAMKRLYARPEFHATGPGVLLARRAIEDARARGFRRVLLDTPPSMRSAQRLYERLGFRDTAPVASDPGPGVRCMALDLARTDATAAVRPG